jgi:fructose-1,6-bisphosphatase/inositol monophosphatase family enzyme
LIQPCGVIDTALRLIESAIVTSLPGLVQFANTVANGARSTSLRYFRAGPELLVKSDGSPVTVADRETERVIGDLLSQSYPQHAVMGEPQPVALCSWGTAPAAWSMM